MVSLIIRNKKAIAIIALCFPLLLNLLLAIPTPVRIPVIGDGADWLLFWATYITALASFAMVIASYETLIESRKQWKEDHIAYIGVTTYQDKYHQVFMRICNMSSVGVIIQSIQIQSEPSDTVKDLFCIVKSNEYLDKYSQWQHIYEHSYIVIRPYEYEDILFLQNFPRQVQEEVGVVIQYNNTCEIVKIDLNNIFRIQRD